MSRVEDKENKREPLDDYRKEIDEIDEQLISLLIRRQDMAALIGEFKRDLGSEVFDAARENEIFRRVISKSRDNLSPESTRHIFSEIISAARSVQQPLVVALLGPEGTFSHQAAISIFGRSVLFRTTETIEDVFELVEKGTCQRGVVPIENSYEGSIGSTLDFLFKYDLKISSELFLRIRHHLLSREDDMVKIKNIYSHPMAIAHCRSWIKRNLPNVSVKAMESTAIAAQTAAGEPDAASVGSRLAALHYGLNLLEENIEDHPGNITRFLVIGKSDSEPTGKDRTSLLFSLVHRPGALHRALGSLALKDINMTRIESRPIKIKDWEYLFFVDIQGHEHDSNVREAIEEMERHCAFLKRLGSFPEGGEPRD